MKIYTIIKKLKLSKKNHHITWNGLLVDKSEYSEDLLNGDELIIQDVKYGDYKKWCVKYLNKKLYWMHPLQHYYKYS